MAPRPPIEALTAAISEHAVKFSREVWAAVSRKGAWPIPACPPDRAAAHDLRCQAALAAVVEVHAYDLALAAVERLEEVTSASREAEQARERANDWDWDQPPRRRRRSRPADTY
jgi:hypothetical protein